MNIPGHESERSLDNPQYNAFNLELVVLFDFDIRVLRVQRFQNYASFPVQVFFHNLSTRKTS